MIATNLIMMRHIYTLDDVIGVPYYNEGHVFTLHGKNTLSCFSINNNELKWSIQLSECHSVGSDLPMVLGFGDRLIVTGEYNFWIIDKTKGEIIMNKPEGQLDKNIYINDNIIYGLRIRDEGSSDILKLDTKTHKLSLFPITSHDFYHFKGINQNLYVAWRKSKIVGVEYENSLANWSFSVEEIGRYERHLGEWMTGTIKGEPVNYQNIIIFNVVGYHLVAIDCISGDLLWKCKIEDDNSANRISIVDDVICVTGYSYYYEINPLDGQIMRIIETKSIHTENDISLIVKHYIYKNVIVLLYGRHNSKLALADRDSYYVKQIIDLKGAVWDRYFSGFEDKIITRDLNGILKIFSIEQE